MEGEGCGCVAGEGLEVPYRLAASGEQGEALMPGLATRHNTIRLLCNTDS